MSGYKDGESYCPSNGSEGCGFIANHCDQCLHHDPDNERASKTCDIFGRSLAFSPGQPEYPKEWQYRNGKPTCTSFQKWDWNTDGDPDDEDNPKAPPPPPDPRQLNLFPLFPDEQHFNQEKLLTIWNESGSIG